LERLAVFAPEELPALALHGVANFPVQAYLRSLRTPEEAPIVAAAARALQPTLGALLTGRRGGVAASLLAAATATGGEAPREAARAMARALKAQYGGVEAEEEGGKTYVAKLAPALLRSVSGGATRTGFSIHGCACLTLLLRLPPPAGRAFRDSLAALEEEEAVAAAEDPAASRCLEALLRGDGGGGDASAVGLRRKLAATLAPSWPRLASHNIGRHVLSAAWQGASSDPPREKEQLLKALLPAARALGGGPLRGVLQEYARDPEAWRKRQGAAAKLEADFSDILKAPAVQAVGKGGGKAAGKREGGGKGAHREGNSIRELSAGIQAALAGLK